MRELPLSAVKRDLSKLVKGSEAVCLTVRGRPVAVLTPDKARADPAGMPGNGIRSRPERPDDDQTHIALAAKLDPPGPGFLRLLDVMKASLD